MRTPWGENLEAHGCASKCRESTGMCEAASLSAIFFTYLLVLYSFLQLTSTRYTVLYTGRFPFTLSIIYGYFENN